MRKRLQSEGMKGGVTDEKNLDAANLEGFDIWSDAIRMLQIVELN